MAKQKTFLERMDEADFAGLVSVRTDEHDSQFVESLTSFINLLNDKKMGKYAFGHALEEAATTSDFPILLGTVLDQQLLAQYKLITADWRDYIATGTQSDFRPSQLNKIWGLEKPLPAVPQHGEYQEVSMTEGKVQMSLGKYGKVFGLTFEDLINDRLGAFSDAANMLSRSAYKTEYRFATGLYSVAAGPNPLLFGAALAHPIDGVVINNKTNLPLTADNLAVLIGNIRRQRDADGEPIFFERIHIVVPAALEIQLKTILNPASLIVSGGDATAGVKGVKSTSANILNDYSIVPHVNPYLGIVDTSGAGDKTWYIFVDKADAPAIQMNFLRGHETPEVFMKASNQTTASGGTVSASEGSFEDDTLWWKVRHIMGGVQIDPRAAFASVAP